MPDQPYTIEQRDALRAALARGEHRVSFGDRSIQYRSVAELQAALREVEAAINDAAGTPRPRHVRIDTAKGF